MSRSGYSDDIDPWALIRWRGAVNSAMSGTRGQAFIREAIAALDAMPEKSLGANSLRTSEGEFCTLGAVAHARGKTLAELETLPADDYEGLDRRVLAKTLGIAPAMTAEIMFMNDEANWYNETGAARWLRMRNWLASQLKDGA